MQKVKEKRNQSFKYLLFFLHRMATKSRKPKKTDEKFEVVEQVKQQAQPFDIFKDMYEYVLKKYNPLTIDNFEIAVAWMLLEMDESAKRIAPDAETVPMIKSIEDLLYISRGNNNTILRIISKSNYLYSKLEEAKKENVEKEPEKEVKPKTVIME